MNLFLKFLELEDFGEPIVDVFTAVTSRSCPSLWRPPPPISYFVIDGEQRHESARQDDANDQFEAYHDPQSDQNR